MTERARTWRSSQMSTTSFKLTWKKRIVAPHRSQWSGRGVMTVDEDNNGSVCFSEFLMMIAMRGGSSGSAWAKIAQNIRDAAHAFDPAQKRVLSVRKIGHYAEVFRRLDRDGDGEVTSSEILAGMEGLGLRATRGEVDALVDQFDDDGDGHLNLCEFLQMLCVKRGATSRVRLLASKIATNLTKAHDLSWDERAEAVQIFADIDEAGANAVSGREVLEHLKLKSSGRCPSPLVRLLAHLGPNSDINDADTLDLRDFLTWVGDLRHADVTEFSERNRLLTFRGDPSPKKRTTTFFASKSSKYRPRPAPEDVDWADLVKLLPLGASKKDRDHFEIFATKTLPVAALLHRSANGGDSLLHYCAYHGDDVALTILLTLEPLRRSVAVVNDVGLHAAAIAPDAKCNRILRPWLNYSLHKLETAPRLRESKSDGSAAAAHRLRFQRAARRASNVQGFLKAAKGSGAPS